MLKIVITGDTHGDGEFERFKWAEELGVDILIIAGDFGYVWSNPLKNKVNLDILEKKNVITLFIDGNHENFAILNAFPTKQWNGGLVHELRPNVLHLMRGEVYQIDGKTIAVMGGAKSIDKAYRITGKSWWKQEMPNKEEMDNLEHNLELVDWTVDYFISHTPSTTILKEMNPRFKADKLTDFLDSIEEKLSYKHWYYGHMHESFESKRINCTGLYYDMIELE